MEGMLKSIMDRLSKLEKGKGKKNVVWDEDLEDNYEDTKWDEHDKAEYEQKKKIERMKVDNKKISERMEAMYYDSPIVPRSWWPFSCLQSLPPPLHFLNGYKSFLFFSSLFFLSYLTLSFLLHTSSTLNLMKKKKHSDHTTPFSPPFSFLSQTKIIRTHKTQW